MASDVLEIRYNDEQVRFPARLLDKLDVAGPRYTSYPTAPEWTERFGPREMAETLDQSNQGSPAPLSLYMHLPFCERLCLFCGCNVVIDRKRSMGAPYLERLKGEIDRVARRLDPARPVVQFHWGGGTPTYFPPAELEDLFEHTRSRFRFDPEAEIGVEVDPRVTTPEHVRTLRRLGFNRLSMGVQDFESIVQQTVRRIQPYAATKDLLDLGRAEGFQSVNADLIYGLPHQSVDSFARTLELVIAMNPDRVAMYSYAHVPWLKKQQGSFARFVPKGREKFRLFALGLERFTRAGYRFIGFDHFARPGDELSLAQDDRTLTRNFQGYSTRAGADLVGFGVTAISGVGRTYAQNFRDLASYERRLDAGELATMRGMRLDEDDVIRRDVITRILCHCRLRKSDIEGEHGIDFDRYFAAELERLGELERDGLVRLAADEIAVTLLGRLFLRVVGMVFDVYLRRRESTQPLYSKTV